MATKAKINKWAISNLKALHSKENHQKNKKQYTKWEKILINQIFNKGLTPKIYEELRQLNNNQSENGQKIKETFFQRRNRWPTDT